MENLVSSEYDVAFGNELIEDQMWSLFQQTYPFDDDWLTTNSPVASVVNDDIDENYFATEDEKDEFQNVFTVPIINSAIEEVEHDCSEGCSMSAEAAKPKGCSVATMRIVKLPVGWKFPAVESEKRLLKTNCCVVGCRNSPQRCPTGVKFHSFPGKAYEKERKDLWIAAINRVNPDGTPWLPTKHSKVCSAHFVGGVVSNIASHPSYVPSIFPSSNKVAAKSSSTQKKH